MKRKISEELKADTPSKKQNTLQSTPSIKSAFRSDLFEDATLKSFRNSYDKSSPYPHAVVPSLIEDTLLRSVRSEITEHISFTLKETDIYKIHQSGDLANLSKLDAESLKHLPSLVRLRNALYSPQFREWVAGVTGAGKVSGQKTDMAVNVYTPGSYLLCHDDVIGSRRVSYILYLTDPDHPWKPEWGGGLRLYPTEPKKNKNGEEIKVPLAEHNLNIPPSFGQLSFFAVRPGESYHDVEEVYHGKSKKADGGRIRMAISGWYHIPQEGEEGYEVGVEEAQAQRSSLAQLKSADNQFDEPQPNFRHYDEPRTVMNSTATAEEEDPGDESDQDDDILTEQDLTFLLQYITPSFLTPDMIEQFSASFESTSVLQLETFFNPKFADILKKYITSAESSAVEDNLAGHASQWQIARPPHKHRYAYLQDSEGLHSAQSPVSKVLADLLHSHAFKKWLALIAGLKAPSLVKQNVMARRFRCGADYALANAYPSDHPQLEFTISMTPSTGWEVEEKSTGMPSNGHASGGVQVELGTTIEFGGEEVYMAGDDDDESIHSKSLPYVGKKADPAVYRSAQDDEDDGILFTDTPSWNKFSIVLRDKGTLRFVKYVSQAAVGDRWDIKGEVELSEDAFDGGDVDEVDMDPDSGMLGEDEVEEEIEFGEDGEDEDEDDEDEE